MVLADLLPQFPDLILKDKEMRNTIAYLLHFFAEEVKQAINCFRNREIYRFDPHVGETSCQIRAHMILCLFYQKREQILSQAKFFIDRLTNAQKEAFFSKKPV